MRKQFLTYCLLLLTVVALSQKRIEHTRILVEDQGNGILFSWKKSTKGHKLTPLNGEYIILYDNYFITGKYRKGLSQGTLRRFGADGTLLQEAEYDDRGFPQGEKRCFYSNGKLECRTPFKQGRIDGLYEEWYENGARKTSAEMLDGLHDGITMSWDESGNILSKWNYAKNLRDGALHLAVAKGNLAMSQRLLDSGAHMNVRDDNGETPLMYAVASGLEITRLLLERGADVNVTDNHKRTALTYAKSEEVKKNIEGGGCKIELF